MRDFPFNEFFASTTDIVKVLLDTWIEEIRAYGSHSQLLTSRIVLTVLLKSHLYRGFESSQVSWSL